MKASVLALSFATVSALATVTATVTVTAIAAASPEAEVAPLLQEMAAAANRHDVERHVGFYAHDPKVTLIVDGEAFVGWEVIRDKQREWWQNGATDVTYVLSTPPEFSAPAPGFVVSTLFLTSHRTLPGGEVRDGRFAVSALWQKRPEGWRIIYSHESTSR